MYEVTWIYAKDGRTVPVFSICDGLKVRAGDKVRVFNVPGTIFVVAETRNAKTFTFSDPLSGKNMVPVQTSGSTSTRLWVLNSDLVLAERKSLPEVPPGTMLESSNPYGNKYVKLGDADEWLVVHPRGSHSRKSQEFLYSQLNSFRNALDKYMEDNERYENVPPAAEDNKRYEKIPPAGTTLICGSRTYYKDATTTSIWKFLDGKGNVEDWHHENLLCRLDFQAALKKYWEEKGDC